MPLSVTGCDGLQRRPGTFVCGSSWHVIVVDKHPMITVQRTSPDPMGRMPTRSTAAIEREAERPGTLPVEDPPTVTAQFRPLDAGIVNEAIPAFFIGRNKEGFWVARDARGQIGGLFLLENSALSFARRNSRPAGCATIFPTERFELDLENKGNPLVAHLASWRRLATRLRQRTIAIIGKMTQAVKRRFGDFRVL